jgi:diguanylate cyclase (GGDEF)-like protein
MKVSALLLLISLIWFAVNLVRPVGPHVLLWLPTPISALILTAIFRRTARTTSLLMPTRRFWGQLSIAAVLVGIAASSQAIDVLLHPEAGGSYIGPVLLIFDSCAIAIIVYALYRLPLGALTPGERLRVALDGGTVMAGAAVFILRFQTRQALGTDDGLALAGSLVLAVLALVVVLAVAKVVLSGYEFIDQSALRWLAFAIFFGATSSMLQPLLAPYPYLLVTQISVPGVFCLGAWAAERQRVAVVTPHRRAIAHDRRPFSLVPYGAVAAVDALLLTDTWLGDPSDNRMIVVGAVTLTALVVVRQITAFRDNGQLLARLDYTATHDALTQLPNRTLFGHRLHQALTAPGSRPVSVALIDLDDFKEVNDTLGHEVGDLLLVSVAQRLVACVRAEDTVARLGGDEFVVVLDGADPAAADLAAERMIAAFDQPVVVDGHELPISISIGIALGHTGDEASMLLRHADIAMYAAKKLIGTAYLHYDIGMASAVTDQASLGTQLRTAIADGQLFLLYQPIVSLHDGSLIGVEALVRWEHPVHGVVAPDAFIPVAERTGLIVPLGRWVFREACRQFAAWVIEHGNCAPATLNVNISARELREPDFAENAATTMAECDIAAHRIVLEVTESMVIELGPSIAILAQLRALGIRISLDDFGTASSTLSLLHNCPVDEIKLDKSFTQAEIDGRTPMAAAVVLLAHTLGLHAVAEGVETPEQAEQLRSLGYTAAQGYLFARPMRPEHISEWLDSKQSQGMVTSSSTGNVSTILGLRVGS